MLNLRSILLVISLLSALVCGAWETPAYLGVSGGMLLPGNGSSLSRAAETSVRAGIYTSEFLAWEIEGACAPNASSSSGREALSRVALRGLCHLSALESFDRLFGCERFDPFVTFGAATFFGARSVFADGSHRTAMGPSAGLGAFYHLTENLDIRLDAQAMLGCDSPCGLLYSVVVGLQWNFGGSAE